MIADEIPTWSIRTYSEAVIDEFSLVSGTDTHVCGEHMLTGSFTSPAVQLHGMAQILVSIRVTRVRSDTSFMFEMLPRFVIPIVF